MQRTDYAMIIHNITRWLHDYLEQSGEKGFVIGLSGGIDSSTTAVLCRRVTPNTLGVLLPCHSSPDSSRDAERIAEKFDIPIILHDLTPVYDHLVGVFNESPMMPQPSKIALGNIKARLRMLTLYFHANRLDRLVVGSGNGVEIMLGYFTKFGDGGADIWPIGDLLKRDVRHIAKDLGIPENIIKKPPTADLWPGQTDEKELGVSYDVLDSILGGDPLDDINAKTIEMVKQRIKKAWHKNPFLPPKPPGPICKVHNLYTYYLSRLM
ncbi:MAG: NAD(+) synthase [Candidatus Ranarchaeia archaeon]